MPKRAKELSPVEIRRLTTPGVHPVGGIAGLMLQVKESGAKSWVLRYATGATSTSKSGKVYPTRRDLGLGPFPEVGLGDARKRAQEAREKLRQGIDPIVERQAARDALRAAQGKGMTFDEAARRFLATKTREFRNPKHAAQWGSTLERYANPVIGPLPVDRIELAHIVEILTRADLWNTKTETAKRLRGRIEAVLDWATVSGHRTGDNPAQWKGRLDKVLPAPGKIAKVTHQKALPIDAAPGFLTDLRKQNGLAARGLEFVMLTAARSGEVRLATWEEIDLESGTWTIPGERMKAGRAHVVPLTDAAIALLKALPRFHDCPYVFPSPRGKAFSDMSLSAVMRRMKVDAVPHGLRSTFRDWCSERTNYPRDVAEMALAHTIGDKVEAAYRRGDLLTKRTRMMEDWARFLNTPVGAGVVTPIRSSKQPAQA